MKDQILSAVADTVPHGDCIAALGGGADSAVLIWAAVEALTAERVEAIFVHHRLEGSDSLRDSAVAAAAAVGVECRVVERPVHDGGNLEARARAQRYDAIEAVVSEGTVALTGHSADDQAETVLMRILRGSGTGAASGIPQRRGVWRRPLLGFSREALRSVAIELSLPFFDDPANTDPRFLRTRIRHGVLPVIESQLGPDSRTRILKSAELFAADDELLERRTGEVQIVPIEGGVSIPLGPLRTLPEPVASRVVRRALRLVLNGYAGSAADIGAVLVVAAGGSAVTISGSHRVVVESPFVTIVRRQPSAPIDGFDVTVGEPFRWHESNYTTGLRDGMPLSVGGGRLTPLGARAIGDRFHVRGLRSGDRIQMEHGSTPVKELLRSAGVPERVRPHSLIVTVGGKIAAVVGVRVARWARPDSGDATVTIEKEGSTWR